MGSEMCIRDRDYYHWDCAFPETVKFIVERNDLSEATKKRILGENAKKFFAL